MGIFIIDIKRLAYIAPAPSCLKRAISLSRAKPWFPNRVMVTIFPRLRTKKSHQSFNMKQ